MTHRNHFRKSTIKTTTTVYATAVAILLLMMILPALEIATNTAAFAQAISSTTGATMSGNPPSTDNFNLEEGYTIEPVVWNLTAPDSVTFDDQGNMYIAEAGYPFTGLPQVPRILKVDSQTGNVSVLINTGLNAPVVDINFNEDDGLIYVAHRDKISTVDMEGEITDIVVGLPANGDHHVNQIAFSQDGQRMYFGVGTATDSGVVDGADPVNLGWLKELPFVHDIPGKNITLAGVNYEMPNPLTAEENDTILSGAFVPFGTITEEGQVIEGDTKCNGCILSANLDGTDLRLEGWGFRNPTGLEFNEEGRLFTAVHGADEARSRPIADDEDKFYEVILNETEPPWYGWPDYFGDAQPVTDPRFQSELSNETLQFVMAEHPEVVEPLALFQPAHTAVIQMDFADESFGFAGEAFVSQMGAFRPTPPELGIVGQDIVRVNPDSGNISQFLMLEQPSTSFRPTDVLFHEQEEDGNNTALYVVDWGNLELPPMTIPNSGIVWKITKTEATQTGEIIPRNNTQPGG